MLLVCYKLGHALAFTENIKNLLTCKCSITRCKCMFEDQSSSKIMCINIWVMNQTYCAEKNFI